MLSVITSYNLIDLLRKTHFCLISFVGDNIVSLYHFVTSFFITSVGLLLLNGGCIFTLLLLSLSCHGTSDVFIGLLITEL